MANERPQAVIVTGPVLLFRGTQGDRWRLSALFVLEGTVEPDDLVVDGVSLPVPPRHLASWRSLHLWRFDFAVPRRDRETRVGYRFPTGRSWSVTVPALTARPRIAFVSGNGVPDEGDVSWPSGGRNERWSSLSQTHSRNPFHLLIHGGGQVYADGLWDACPALGPILETPIPARFSLPFTRSLADQLMNFYFRLYCRTWSQPEVSAVLSAVPSIMAWDDHDIFDGWGALSEAAQNSQVSRGVFQVARRHYSLFQVGTALREPPDSLWGAGIGNFTQGYQIGELGILALDMRSERTERQVFSEATWKELPKWLWRFQGCRQLLIVSSVPVAFVRLGGIERKLVNWWTGDRYRDDLRDQWRGPLHQADWLRFVGMISTFSLTARCHVAFVSGEINLGAHGVIRGMGADLRQFISSGVVHPPPSGTLAWFLEQQAGGVDQTLDDFSVEMLPFEGTGRRFIRARNWLDIGFDKQGRFTARWNIEGQRSPLQFAA